MVPGERISLGLISVLTGFGSMTVVALFLRWFATLTASQQIFVGISVIGGLVMSFVIYCYLTKDEWVYLVMNDEGIKAICTNWIQREILISDGDIVRQVPLDKEIGEPVKEELRKKTKEGYVEVEDRER